MIMDVFGRLILTTTLLTPHAKPAPLPKPENYAHLEERPENNWLRAPEARESRPAGDHRTAEQIAEANPALKDFLDMPGSYRFVEALKTQVGDWTTNNPDHGVRADAMYALARVTNFLDNVNDRQAGGSQRGNDKIDGFYGYYRDGYGTERQSEARLLELFANDGYVALSSLGF
jgi:hypothetical protein